MTADVLPLLKAFHDIMKDLAVVKGRPFTVAESKIYRLVKQIVGEAKASNLTTR